MRSPRKSSSGRAAQLGLLAALVALVLCGARDARAERPPTMIVIDEGSEGLARKLRAEAMHIGLAVVEARGQRSGSDLQLLERSGAVALIRVSSEDQVEVLVAGPDDRGLYSETLRRRPGEDEAFAVRAVEQVRARLIELKVWTTGPDKSQSAELPPAAPRGDPSSAEPSTTGTSSAEPSTAGTTSAMPAEADRVPVAPGDRPASPRLWFDAGAAGILPGGGVGPSAHGVIGARFEPDARWGVAAHAFLPLLDSDVSAPEGEAEVGASLFTAELAYALHVSERWLGACGVGGGVLVLAMSGEAQTPYVARDDRLTAGVYYVHASMAHGLAGWLRVRAALFAGFSAPRPVLRFDDREAASWGRAFAGMAVQAEAGAQ